MNGPQVDLVAGGHLDQLAQVHHTNSVREVLDHREVVGDDYVGETVGRLEAVHEVEDLRPDGDVERRNRLVSHDQLGVEGQRPGQPDALTLSAGELVGVEVDRLGAEPHLLEQLPDPGGLFRFVADLLHHQGLADDGPHPHPRVQGGVGVLEHQLQIAAAATELLPLERGDVGSLEPDLARSRPLQAHDHPANGRLAAPRLSHQAEGLTLLDPE